MWADPHRGYCWKAPVSFCVGAIIFSEPQLVNTVTHLYYVI